MLTSSKYCVRLSSEKPTYHNSTTRDRTPVLVAIPCNVFSKGLLTSYISLLKASVHD